MFDQSLTRVRPGTRVDRGGNTVPDWAAATRTEISRLSVQPLTQKETADAERTAVVTGWRVLSEPGTAPDIRSTDRVEFDGMTLEVVGEVARWPDPLDGGVHHIEVTLQRATG